MGKLNGYSKWRELQGELKILDKYLYKMSLSGDPQVTAAVQHILQAGGKRMRPAFALSAAKIYNCPMDRLLPLLAALEIIHTASLVHDDIIDGSPRRRGLPTINELHGNKMAVATGDFLVGISTKLLSGYSDPRILASVVHTTTEMCCGELRQLDDFYRVDQGLRCYLYRIQRKTALLFATSCVTGAYVAEASESECIALKRFGYYLGMAFQIMDDILDMIGDEKILGKPVGSDLRCGNLSLPVIYALHNAPYKEDLAQMILAKPQSDGQISTIIKLVEQGGGIIFADEFAQKYVDKALAQLDFLPQNDEVDLLRYAASLMTKRNY